MLKKLKAKKIFDGFNFLEGKVLVLDAHNKILDVVDENTVEDVEVLDGVLTPGFVNCHCHLELSHLQGRIPQKTGLVGFVQQVMQNKTAPLDEIAEAIGESYALMRREGIVAVGDICNTNHTVNIKVRNSDIVFTNFIEVSGFVEATARERFAAMEKVAADFENAGLTYSFVPHSPYSVSKKLFGLISDASAGKLVSIHNQETKEEDVFVANGTGGFLALYNSLGIDLDKSGFQPSGKSSFATWNSYMNKPLATISVHNTFIDKNDLTTAPKNTWFCLCPNANLYIENTLPPLATMMKETDNLVLGTDSLASNGNLSILAEMQVLKRANPSIRWEKLLQWATSNGAAALGLSGYGKIKPGTKPGIVLLQEDFSAAKLLFC